MSSTAFTLSHWLQYYITLWPSYLIAVLIFLAQVAIVALAAYIVRRKSIDYYLKKVKGDSRQKNIRTEAEKADRQNV